jgi:hypothetical protein
MLAFCLHAGSLSKGFRAVSSFAVGAGGITSWLDMMILVVVVIVKMRVFGLVL